MFPNPIPSAPLLFDRALLRRRQLRALRAPEDFLLRLAIEEMTARIATAQRPFRMALAYGQPSAHLAQALARQDRVIVWSAPVAAKAALSTSDRSAQAADSGNKALRLVADEEAAPFADAVFDLVACALNLQWANDLPGALAQIRRMLRPDGLLMACLVGGQSLKELRACLTEAEAALESGASPRVTPFADVRDMGDLLRRAGFALPVADNDRLTVRYASMFALMADLRAMGATNPLTQRAKKPLRRATLFRAAEIYAERFSDADGKIRATFDIIWLSGWAPHESQQKPLKPGSAQMRLADALNSHKTTPSPK